MRIIKGIFLLTPLITFMIAVCEPRGVNPIAFMFAVVLVILFTACIGVYEIWRGLKDD